jgi:hypothetical protein
MPYMCLLCDGEESAVLLITPLTGGETLAVGNACYMVGLTGLMSSFLEVDAEGLYDAIRGHVNALAEAEAAGTADSPGEAATAATAPPGAAKAPGRRARKPAAARAPKADAKAGGGQDG